MRRRKLEYFLISQRLIGQIISKSWPLYIIISLWYIFLHTNEERHKKTLRLNLSLILSQLLRLRITWSSSAIPTVKIDGKIAKILASMLTRMGHQITSSVLSAGLPTSMLNR